MKNNMVYNDFFFNYNNILNNEDIKKASFSELSVELINLFSQNNIKSSQVTNLHFHIYFLWLKDKNNSFLCEILEISDTMTLVKNNRLDLNILFEKLKNVILNFYNNN
jgi:hypothetical protein